MKLETMNTESRGQKAERGYLDRVSRTYRKFAHAVGLVAIVYRLHC